MRLKVCTANFYVMNQQPVKDARFLASLGVDLAGIQEGHHGNAQDIRRTLHSGFVTYWGRRSNPEIAKAMLDVPVVVDRKFKILKKWARKLCDRSDERGIGMARAATAVRIQYGGRTITFINTHLNAGVQNKDTRQPFSALRNKRVREYIKSIIILELMIRNAKRRGDLVILVGDLNFVRQVHNVWRFSPQAMFKRVGMEYHVAHVDYIAYSRAFRARWFNIVSKFMTGSDHNWATLELMI